MADASVRVRGLWHLALRVRDASAAAAFYREHRDGSVSFYCRDPDGNLVQVLWPPA